MLRTNLICIDLKVHYISTIINPADIESRKLSLQDLQAIPQELGICAN